MDLFKRFQSLTSQVKWGLIGALFGFCFPVIAVLIRYFEHLNSTIAVISADPLVWIIFTAPVFLGLFSMFGGIQNDKVKQFSTNLEHKIEERTIHLKQTSQALKSEKNHLATILNSISDALVVIDKDLLITPESSARAHAIFNQDPQGKQVLDLLYPVNSMTKSQAQKDRIHLENSLVGCFELLVSSQFNAAIAQAPKVIKLRSPSDQNLLYLQLTLSPIIDEQDQITNIIITLSDITEIRKAQNSQEFAYSEIIKSLLNINKILNSEIQAAAFRESLHELVKLSKDCQQMVQSLKQEDLNSLFRNMHTVKGGVRSFGLSEISYFAHIFETEIAELKEQKKNLNHLDTDNLQRYASLVSEGLHALYQISTTKPAQDEVKKDRSWDVYSLQTITSAELLAADLGKKIRLSIESDFALQGKDLNLLKKSLIHIIRNCIDHGIEAPEKRLQHSKNSTGKIQIKVQKTSESWQVLIEDDGKGINRAKVLKIAKAKGIFPDSQESLNLEELTKAICSPGLSSKDQISDISGRGVGLDAVKEEVNKKGGSFAIASSDSKGTQFVLQWPCLAEGVPSSPYLESKNILLVDDEHEFISIISEAIQNLLPNINILKCHSGKEAIGVLQKNCISLIITDLNMPKGSGFELLDEINTSYPDLQKCVLTGNADAHLRGALSRLNCTVMEKPVDFLLLSGFIDQILRKNKLI